MTRRQRRTHRLIWTVLAPLLLAAVAGALMFRPAPLVQATPAEKAPDGN